MYCGRLEAGMVELLSGEEVGAGLKEPDRARGTFL
jgi:hypothetical protein